jgi:hypothetical protein
MAAFRASRFGLVGNVIDDSNDLADLLGTLAQFNDLSPNLRSRIGDVLH